MVQSAQPTRLGALGFHVCLAGFWPCVDQILVKSHNIHILAHQNSHFLVVAHIPMTISHVYSDDVEFNVFDSYLLLSFHKIRIVCLFSHHFFSVLCTVPGIQLAHKDNL